MEAREVEVEEERGRGSGRGKARAGGRRNSAGSIHRLVKKFKVSTGRLRQLIISFLGMGSILMEAKNSL